jgi:hypothetical protein
VPIYFFQAKIEYINPNCKAHRNIDVYILLVHKQPYICVNTYEIELSLPKCICVYIVTRNYVSTLYKHRRVGLCGRSTIRSICIYTDNVPNASI